MGANDVLTPTDPKEFQAQVLRRAAQIERRRARTRAFVAVPAVVACVLAGVLAVQVVDQRPTDLRVASEQTGGAVVVPTDTVDLGEELRPWAAVAGPDGAMWVLARSLRDDLSSLVRINDEERSVVPLPSGARPESLDVGPDGALWLLDPLGRQVLRVTLRGSVSAWETASSSSVSGATGSDGRFWFAEPDLDRLTGVAPDGTMTHREVEAGGRPNVVAAAPDGSIWFAYDALPKIGSLSSSGDVGSYDVPVDGGRVAAMAGGPGLSLWLAVVGDDGARLARVDATGAVVVDPVIADAAPHDLSLGPDGSLWYSTSRSRTISRRGLVRSSTIRVGSPLRVDSWALAPDASMWAVDRAQEKVVRIFSE